MKHSVVQGAAEKRLLHVRRRTLVSVLCVLRRGTANGCCAPISTQPKRRVVVENFSFFGGKFLSTKCVESM